MNIEPLIATIWLIVSMALILRRYDPIKYTPAQAALAWFILGWLPTIFYKIYSML